MLRKTKFWSLIELTIILTVLSILCAILAPVIDRFVRNAKIIRCREDVQAIGNCVHMFIEDTACSFFMRRGNSGGAVGGASRGNGATRQGSGGGDNCVDLVVSDGDIPQIGPDGADQWGQSVDFGEVDFLAHHLITNNPGNKVARAYRTPSDLTNPNGDPMFARNESSGFNSEFAWRGPYITAPIDPDPWGNRYGINSGFLDPVANSGNATAPSNGYEYDVVVLSAGPDEEIDTQWSVDGLTPGDDDLLYTLSSNSRP